MKKKKQLFLKNPLRKNSVNSILFQNVCDVISLRKSLYFILFLFTSF